MDQALAIVEDERYIGQPIDRDLVIEFGDSLMGIHPAAKEVGVVGMRSAAQLALVTGCNPLPGVNGLHVWKDKNGQVCIQFGIGFLRSQAEIEGGYLWIYRPRPMTDQERDFYGIAEKQTASICSGALKRDVLNLLRDMRDLDLEITLSQAKQEVGQIGVGIVNPNEFDANGRTKQWKADLRSERDLLRKLVPIMQRARQNKTYVSGGQGWRLGQFVRVHKSDIPEDYSIEDANRDLIEPGEVIEAEIIEPATEAQEAIDPPSNGFGKRPFDPETLKRIMDKKTQGDDGTLASIKARRYAAASLTAITTDKNDRYDLTQFLFNVRSTNDLSIKQAAAVIDWIGYHKEGDDWIFSEDARIEADQAIKHFYIESGQLEFDLDEEE